MSQGKSFGFLLAILLILLYRDFMASNIQINRDRNQQHKPTERMSLKTYNSSSSLSSSEVAKVVHAENDKEKKQLKQIFQQTVHNLENNMQTSIQNINKFLSNFITKALNSTIKQQQKQQDTKKSVKAEITTTVQTAAPVKQNGECVKEKHFQNWFEKNKKQQETDEIQSYLKVNCNREKFKNCSNADLIGKLAVRENNISFHWLYYNELNFVQKGGWWQPDNCLATQSTFIVIPFRKRESQLPILLRQLHPVLRRQNLHYRILVVEQYDKSPFNRAKLLNVGYKEGLKIFPYKCFIMHDVDLIPENDKIDYGCQVSPKHLSAAVSTFQYHLPYAQIFGGVASLWSKHFELINGCSNSFWTWGAEDDNLYNRLNKNGLTLHRHAIEIARYKMLSHRKVESGETFKKRNSRLQESYNYIKDEGLNTLKYEVISFEEKELFTLIRVDLKKEDDKLFGKFPLDV